MIPFLSERQFLHDRLNAGIDVHPDPKESEEFERLAKQISPNGDHSWRGCQECLNHMIKFVFDNQDRLNTEEDGQPE